MTKRGQTSRAGLRHWTDASCKVARRRTRERTRERERESKRMRKVGGWSAPYIYQNG